MSLKEQLMQDLKNAMKEKDEIKKNTVQMVRSAILQIEKDDKVELRDDDIIDVIAKQLKKRKETLLEYEKSGRKDLVNNINTEIEILQYYLPEQLSHQEIETIVSEVITSTGATNKKDMNKVMSEVMPQVKGRADGKQVSEIVKKFLK